METQYITVKDERTVTVMVEDWIGTQELKVTIKDLIQYYVHEACNISSGCRTLAGFTSDWRGVDYVANDCLELFKDINIEELREEAENQGLTPKF